MHLEIKKNHNQSPMTDENGAAEYIGIKPHTMSIWRCTGRYNLPFVKIGRSIKYRYDDLDAFIARNTFGGEVLQ